MRASSKHEHETRERCAASPFLPGPYRVADWNLLGFFSLHLVPLLRLLNHLVV